MQNHLVWVRVGDAGEYEPFDDLAKAVEYLNEIGVGRVDRWVVGGFDTPNYHGNDYVSLYHGVGDTRLTHVLSPIERAYVENALMEVFV